MELAYSLFFWSSICLSVVLLLQCLRGKARNSCRQLPPGPRGWPLVGNLFDLGKFPHLTLFKLGNIYGPVLWLRFGVVNTVVIQSTKAAMEMFKNHDLTYSGRTIIEAMKPYNYYERSMGLAQYGPYWRVIKRLCITEMIVNKQLNETASIRRKGIDKMIQWIEEEAHNQGAVHVAHFVFIMTFNLFGNILLSRDLIDPQSDEGSEFFNAMDTWMQGVGQPNVADFFPILRWFDPQGIRKKIEQNMGSAMDIVSKFLKERIEDQASGEQKKKRDFLDILLEYEGEGDDDPVKISDKGIVILILVSLFFYFCYS
ncbi:Cytochrome p450 [Thalictrum thalictroides]|uniref:Cytochrome p450 n=1 Tax=Thalictrum thalictroides TaxID=46969 RepID=A0A7J6VLK4_THATH|nr:Cytochrome p450 [Thalictrum thalictroides]